MVKKSAAFPAGLYAMLLFALAWLTLPRVFAPLERWLVGSACVLPRVGSVWMGEPAMAGNREELALISGLSAELRERVERHDLAGSGIMMPRGDKSVLCGVLSVGRRGGGGEPSELLLDHTYAELGDYREIVTKGSALLGFLLEPGVGRAADDKADDPARVILCNHRDAPRLYAGLDNNDGTQLRFVVEPAASVDPAALRVDFWDDPYRASNLRESQQRVYTLPVAFGRERVPGGLLVGRTRRWGYEQDNGDETLTIGMFVTPAVAPRALSHVVVWQSGQHPALPIEFQSSLRARRRIKATVYDLPGATHGRHMLVANEDVPDGAAVVQDGLFLGSARGLCLGSALVTSFAASRQDWSLLFLPPEGEGDPIELHGSVVRTEGNVAWLRWTGPSREQLARLGEGFLFTGSNGKFCPACLWIGRAVPDQFERNLLKVIVPVLKGPRIAEVIVAERDV